MLKTNDGSFLDKKMVQVKAGDLIDLLCHINNVSGMVKTETGLKRIFKKPEDMDQLAERYFKLAKRKLIAIINSGLNKETGLEDDLVPFKLRKETLIKQIERRLP